MGNETLNAFHQSSLLLPSANQGSISAGVQLWKQIQRALGMEVQKVAAVIDGQPLIWLHDSDVTAVSVSFAFVRIKFRHSSNHLTCVTWCSKCKFLVCVGSDTGSATEVETSIRMQQQTCVALLLQVMPGHLWFTVMSSLYKALEKTPQLMSTWLKVNHTLCILQFHPQAWQRCRLF